MPRYRNKGTGVVVNVPDTSLLTVGQWEIVKSEAAEESEPQGDEKKKSSRTTKK